MFFSAQYLNTKLWSLKKSTLVDGPNLYHRLIDLNSGYVHTLPYCTATLNRSHFVMIGFKYHQQDPHNMPNRRFALINFQNQQVIDYPNLPFDEFVFCSASIMVSKSYEKSVVIHLGEKSKKKSHLMTYDLYQGLGGQWKIHSTWETDDDSNVLNFWQIRGSFYSLLSNGHFIRHRNPGCKTPCHDFTQK